MNRNACRPLLGTIVLIAVTAAGCAGQPNKALQPAAANVSPSAAAAQPAPSVSDVPQSPGNSPQTTPHTDKGTQTLSNETKPGNQTNDGKTAKGKPFSSDHPSLLGLTLDDTRKVVEERFGKPHETYAMDSGADPVSVSDYGTFSVGFKTDGAIVFIDVSFDEIDPLLGGVKVGGKADEAEKTLGKPDTKSSYALAYESKTTVLKIDLDPKTKSILSIKLFGRDE